jgi:bacterioferritin-associated ferredoxin
MMPAMLLNLNPRRPACARRMTRCECSGVSFEELRRLMEARRLAIADACQQTGCGQTCTACLDDLGEYLTEARETQERAAPGAHEPWLDACGEGAQQG